MEKVLICSRARSDPAGMDVQSTGQPEEPSCPQSSRRSQGTGAQGDIRAAERGWLQGLAGALQGGVIL